MKKNQTFLFVLLLSFIVLQECFVEWSLFHVCQCSPPVHIHLWWTWHWADGFRHRNLSIVPTDTFTPDSFYVAGNKRSQMTKLTNQSKAQSDILFLFVLLLPYSTISSPHLFDHYHRRRLQMHDEQKDKYWGFVTNPHVSLPYFPFFLYWHNIGLSLSALQTVLSSISPPLAFTVV